MKITQEYLKHFFHYDPDTGVFARIRRIKPHTQNKTADCYRIPTAKTLNGYLQVGICGKLKIVHRLIFVYMEGVEPEEDVDHINGDRSDNRWENLRKVSRRENLRNAGLRTDNNSGVIGVCFSKSHNKWIANISSDSKRINIGNFDTKEEAIKAREEYEKLLNYHPNHGKRKGWGSR
jgi:hypothetical protein